MKLNRYKETIIRHAGLLTGSVLGLLSGLHIFGLAIGALLGYFFDELLFMRTLIRRGTRLIEEPAAGLLDERWTRIVISVALACAIASAPKKQTTMGLGERKLLEDRVLKHLDCTGREAGLVRQLIERIFELPTIELSRLAVTYRSVSTVDERLFLIRLLLNTTAGEDERITAGQNELLKQVSEDLELSADAYNTIRSRWIPVDTEAYEIIGLSPEASDREIHKVYRRLASQFHPDTGGDLDDAQREQAGEAFLKIQDAYNRILADRNAMRPGNGREPE